jgi:hypothetical protein
MFEGIRQSVKDTKLKNQNLKMLSIPSKRFNIMNDLWKFKNFQPVLKIFKDNFVTVGKVSVGIDAYGVRGYVLGPHCKFFKKLVKMR